MRALNHFNKHAKGALVRRLAIERPRVASRAGFVRWADAAGLRVREGSSGEIELFAWRVGGLTARIVQRSGVVGRPLGVLGDRDESDDGLDDEAQHHDREERHEGHEDQRGDQQRDTRADVEREQVDADHRSRARTTPGSRCRSR